MNGVSPDGTWGPAAAFHSSPQSGPILNTVTTNTSRHSPSSPKMRSIVSNGIRHTTSHTSTATNGTSSR